MQQQPQHHSDLDGSLVAMGIVMVLAILFLALQFA